MFAPTNPTMVEGSDPGTDTSVRLDGVLLLKNVSKRTLTYQHKVGGAFQLRLDITDAAGGKWYATFLPPPMPRGGRVPRTHKLRPGKAVVLAHLHGISGFRRTAVASGRWYRVLPPGSYRVVARGIDIGTIKTRLASGPTTIKVLSADRPVRGLKLRLRAASETTTRTRDRLGARPVKLELSFLNVGKKAITLDVYRLEQLLVPHVKGNLSYSRRPPQKAPRRKPGAGLVKLEPGKSYVLRELQTPGWLGDRRYHFSGPGWYQLRLEYNRKAPDTAGCWTGQASSNVVWLKVNM